MSKTTTYPALLGDGQGRYRVHMVGNSGESKLPRSSIAIQPLFFFQVLVRQVQHHCFLKHPAVRHVQTTTGIKLAKILGVPYISLDRLFWQPGWKETPKDEFEEKIRVALDQYERGWVVDGEYTRRGGLVAQEQATDVICQLSASSSSFRNT